MKLTERQITAELAAMRPAADPAFLASLEERVGTPGVLEQLRAAVSRRIEPRLAMAAAVLVVAVSSAGVFLANQRDDSGTVDFAKNESGELPAPAGVAAPAPGAPRQVERNASLALSTEPGKLADVADGVVEATDRYGGFIVSSTVNTGDSTAQDRARFQLKVPTPKLQDALADLSRLAHVSSRNEGSLDITAPFVSASARAKDAQAKVDGLLAQLADASSTTETAAIEARLRAARQELAAARAQVGNLTRRSELSTVDVTIAGDGGGNTGSWGIDDALDDAASVLKAIAGAAIVALAVLLPAALLVALVWFAADRSRRRARERALGS